MNRILKTIRSVFRKNNIRILGRVGLEFTYDGKKYFIDSELLNSDEFEIVVYKKGIYVIDDKNRVLLHAEENIKILNKALLELDEMGLRVIVQ